MSGGESALFIAWTALAIVAFVRPLFGLAIALALGRHEFPSRTNAVALAAPFLVACCTVGLIVQRRGRFPRRSLATLAAVAGLVVGVGTVGAGGLQLDALDYGIEKALLLGTVVVPTCALMLSVRSWGQVREFLTGLVATSSALALISLASPTYAAGAERTSALGGGPIVLAQLCSLALLILVVGGASALRLHLDHSLRATLIGTAGVVLGIALLRTQSRFPIVALAAVLAACILAPRLRAGPSARRWFTAERRRAAIVLGAGAAGAFVLLGGSVRFAQLAVDPSAELRRSRAAIWELGADHVASTFPFGGGFGSFSAFAEANSTLDFDYPHNIVLELLGEVGVAPTMAVIATLIVVWRRRPRTPLPFSNAVIPSLCVYSALMVQVSGDLYNSRYIFVFFTLLAVTTRLSRQPDQTPTEPPFPTSSARFERGGHGPATRPSTDAITIRQTNP